MSISAVVGAAIGLLVALVLFSVVALALGIALIAALAAFLAPFLPLLPSSPGVQAILVVLVLSIVFVISAYAIASLSLVAANGAVAPPGAITTNGVELFCRGYAVGSNAGWNFGLWQLLLPGFGIIFATILLIVGLLAAVPLVSRTAIYQAILGWSSWIMPMSWPATQIGLLLFLISVLTAPLFGPITVRIDGTTGTIETFGGISGIGGFAGGFNLGNFTFITAAGGPTTGFGVPGISAHETGHTLNVGALGWIWHFIGNAIEENVAPFGRGASAYGEECAESHLPRAASPAMTGPPFGLWS